MQRNAAFTLVEILVVVGIIVILVAILVPSLEVAMASSQRTRCGTHLAGIGKALGAYVNDSVARTYPRVVPIPGTPADARAGWFLLFGKRGTAAGYDASTDSTADGNGNGIRAVNDPSENQDVAGRPLNAYLGATSNGIEVPIAQCPSDAGAQAVLDNDNDDVFETGVAHAYTELGSSYINAHKDHTGILSAFGNNPIQANQADPSATKVLIGDAPLYGENKWAAERKNRWHSSDLGQRRYNLLFADLHVEFFDFGDPAKTLAQNQRNIERLNNNTSLIQPGRGFW